MLAIVLIKSYSFCIENYTIMILTSI